MSLRKSASETSEPSPEPKFHTLFAHCSNSTSCVTPRSSVIASYFDRPGDLRRARVAALTVLDDLGRALERRALADARHVLPVPLDAVLEGLVRIEAAWVDCELGHGSSPRSRSARRAAGS